MITMTATAANLEELIAALENFRANAASHPSEIYLSTDASTYTLKLVERKLTDGSKVEDLIISPDI